MTGLYTSSGQIGGEDAVSAKIKQFYGEVLFNFAIRFGDSYSKLPGATPIRLDGTEATAKASPVAKRALPHVRVKA